MNQQWMKSVTDPPPRSIGAEPRSAKEAEDQKQQLYLRNCILKVVPPRKHGNEVMNSIEFIQDRGFTAPQGWEIQRLGILNMNSIYSVYT